MTVVARRIISTPVRGAADTWIQATKPHFGILSLGAFLGLKGKHNLDVIGQVAVARAGGQQYHLVSKTAGDLAACKGKRLATDHGDDPKFIDNVVSGGKFKLAEGAPAGKADEPASAPSEATAKPEAKPESHTPQAAPAAAPQPARLWQRRATATG